MKNGYIAFLVSSAVFGVIASVVVLTNNKHQLHYAINQWHTPLADLFFKYSTALAGTTSAVVVFLAFFFINRNWFLHFFFALFVSVGLTATIKFLILPKALRPVQTLEHLRLVAGVENNENHSFPSGHATFIFCLMGVLAAKSPSIRTGVLLSIAATAIAFSRVYLSQHFLIDVLAGGLLGATGAVAGGYLFHLVTANKAK